MIPILYSPFEKNFVSNGVGRLSECTSCIVTEERNGIFECEFVYPCNGKFYEQLIRQNGIVGVIHDDEHDIQPFVIYRHSDPINGMVTFNAHHISYKLNDVIVEPFSADTCADALDCFTTHALTKQPFTFWTDKAVSATYTLDHPANVRELLAGTQGSILDVYGKGEYEFDKFTVKLYVNRGLNRGVTIRYGKNMVDFERTYDESTTYNAVAPYWKNADGTESVVLPEGFVANTAGVTREYPWEQTENGEYITDENNNIFYFRPFMLKPLPLDMSSYWEEAPTVEELRQAATDYLNNNEPWIPQDNIKIDFVELWQTPEYENVAALQRVKLCDTIAVYYPELLVTNASVKVIKVVYNVLTEQYDRMELGEAKTGIIDFINAATEMFVTNEIANETSFLQGAIDHATKMITGGLGGYVVMNANAAGQPQEILIMDTDDINTAVHVIRMNKNGIGFSTTGYEGPYTSAWTIDGNFNADFITAGTMLANRIQGGTLTIGGLDNDDGVIVVRDAYANEIGRWNNEGISLTRGHIDFQNALSYIQVPISNNSATDYARFGNQGFRLHMDGAGDVHTVVIYGSAGSDPLLPANTNNILGLENEYKESDIHWETQFEPYRFWCRRWLNTDNQTHQEFLFQIDEGLSVRNFDTGQELVFLYNGTNSLTPYGTLYVLNSDILCDRHIFAGNYGDDPNECGITSYGSLYVFGTKSRIAPTTEYGDRLLYCYETPTPMFGDIGEGTIDEDGYCYVFLDAVFADTISNRPYQVFLQKYGDGDCYIAERKGSHFVVRGTAGLSFGWELKAKQAGYDQDRLERFSQPHEGEEPSTDYGKLAAEFLRDLERGREAS